MPRRAGTLGSFKAQAVSVQMSVPPYANGGALRQEIYSQELLTTRTELTFISRSTSCPVAATRFPT
jgi:hypothetical protein